MHKFDSRDFLILELCQIYPKTFNHRVECQNPTHKFDHKKFGNQLYYTNNLFLVNPARKHQQLEGWCYVCVKDLMKKWSNSTVIWIAREGWSDNGTSNRN